MVLLILDILEFHTSEVNMDLKIFKSVKYVFKALVSILGLFVPNRDDEDEEEEDDL